MIKRILKILVSVSVVILCGSTAFSENTSTTEASPSSSATAPVQAISKAHDAAGAVEGHDDEVSKEAATITDDEGMADEDMEMPEEDLEDAPAGAQADQ